MGTVNSIIGPGRQMSVTLDISSLLNKDNLLLDDDGDIIPGVYLGQGDTPGLEEFLRGSVLRELSFNHYFQEDEDGDEVLCLDITRGDQTYYQGHRVDLSYHLKRGITNLLILVPHNHKHTVQHTDQVELKGVLSQ
jgi:DNA helicase HerA-like ATPase